MKAANPARVAPTMSPVIRGGFEAFASSGAATLLGGLEVAVYVG